MNTSEITDLLKRAINSDEIMDTEAKVCDEFIEQIEELVAAYEDDGSTTEDDIVDKCTQAVEFVRLLNIIDNVEMDKYLEMPLTIGVVEPVAEAPMNYEDDDEEVELDVEKEIDYNRKLGHDPKLAFNPKSLDY